MRLKQIEIEGFRCFTKKASISFDPELTTFVGENGTGKSTVGLAVSKLFGQVQSHLGGENLGGDDYPYGKSGPLNIRATLELSTAEVDSTLVSSFVPSGLPQSAEQHLIKWLRERGNKITVTLTRPNTTSSSEPSQILWGDLNIWANLVRKGAITLGMPGNPWENLARTFANGGMRENVWEDHLNAGLRLGESPSDNLAHNLGQFLQNQYKLFPEFRSRSSIGSPSGAMESLTGSDLANMLLNLRVHNETRQRERYERIKGVFRTLFPRYKIEAISRAPGSSTPDIQFYEEGKAIPLYLGQVSAGTQQVLSLVANLVAKEGLVVFLEHPEQHLHPHSMRFLHGFLREVSKTNQIIVTTHESYFVVPGAIGGVRRFWWMPEEVQVYGPDLPGLTSVEIGQMHTVLRSVGNREVVFARAVILVEDESQLLFLMRVASTLGYDIDSNSISVIPVGGDSGFKPFRVLLEGLRIPCVSLRDRDWGVNLDHPKDRFFALGAELEKFIDDQGLDSLRQSVILEVGIAKPRVAEELASRLSKDQIPKIFRDVLEAATRLATYHY